MWVARYYYETYWTEKNVFLLYSVTESYWHLFTREIQWMIFHINTEQNGEGKIIHIPLLVFTKKENLLFYVFTLPLCLISLRHSYFRYICGLGIKRLGIWFDPLYLEVFSQDCMSRNLCPFATSMWKSDFH
jgi:hypothetical protein